MFNVLASDCTDDQEKLLHLEHDLDLTDVPDDNEYGRLKNNTNLLNSSDDCTYGRLKTNNLLKSSEQSTLGDIGCIQTSDYSINNSITTI